MVQVHGGEPLRAMKVLPSTFYLEKTRASAFPQFLAIMKHLTDLTINLVDFSGLKQGLEYLIKNGNADLIRGCILETFTSDDEYQKTLWFSVIKTCFPQYLHLVNTILVFG